MPTRRHFIQQSTLAGFALSVPQSLSIVVTHYNKMQNGPTELNFKNPPIENRTLAYWAWLNGSVDKTKMVYELEEMKDKGMQGAFIWDVGALVDSGKIIPAGPAFLGEESLSNISLALKTAGRLALNLGLCTASSWNAGGAWIEEEDASKELLSVTQTVSGPSKKKSIIGTPKSSRGEVKVYTLISSMAIPHSELQKNDYSRDKIINLDKFTLDGKFIEWDVPEGKWDIISFFMCNTGQPLVAPSPNSNGLLIDNLSRRATKKNLDTILTRLAKVSTPENHLKFLEYDSYEFWPTKDWTPGFVEEFKNRYGYDLKPFLPILQEYNSDNLFLPILQGFSSIGERFLGDYKRLVSDLIIENHFAQSVDIANKNGIQMFVEAGHGGSPRVDPLKALGNCGVPMGEFWNRKKNWVTKEAASAAHIYGKKLVASESLTGWQFWQEGPTDYKQLFDIAFCTGLNQVVIHNFAHNLEIAGRPGFSYHAGTNINVNTTWWEMAKPFMDYQSRCSYMLRQGNFVGDLCCYYGDQAPNLVPTKRIDPNITPLYDDDHCLHCGNSKPVNPGKLPGYDYDYMNADIITSQLKVKKRELVLPSGQAYKMMLIPDREEISLEVLKSLEKLVYDGAIIIGRKPQRATSLKNYPQCDSEVKAIADKMWGGCDSKTILSNSYGKGTVYWGKSVKEVLDERKIPPDLEVIGIDNMDQHIDYIHRKIESQDIYFLSNSNPDQEKVTCVFRVDKNMVPELWDAETELVQRKIEYSKAKNGISIDFVLDPLGSRFIVFRDKSSRKNDAGLSYDLQYGFNRKQKVEKIHKPIDISYNWNIKFNPDMGGPNSYHLDSLVSWSDVANEGIKYYSGSASYEKNFSVDEGALSNGTNVFVIFEDVQEMARVFMNGNDCGIVWTLPYKAEITKYLRVGQNHITVQVINTWNNRLVGDLRNPDKKQYTNTNIKSKFSAHGPLLKSGLIGKVEIFFSS